MTVMQYEALYLEINLFCCIIVAVIMIRSNTASQMKAQRVFLYSSITVLLFFITDTLCQLMLAGIIPYAAISLLLLKSIYFLSSTLMCMSWFWYFDALSRKEPSEKVPFHTLLLAIIQFILNLFNFRYGFFFSAGAERIYTRGPLFLLQYLFSYSFVVLAEVRSLKTVLKRKEYIDKDYLRMLAVFPIMPAAAGIIQYFYPFLPVACCCITLDMLMLYLDSMEDLISLDSLTGLNNRKRLLNSIADRMHGQSRSHQYLMMIDADHFKAINDTYGHLEGDNALRTLADVLRQACIPLKKRAIIGRYGGDEFIICMEADTGSEASETADSIHSLLNETSALHNLPYTLSASVGIARCTDDMKTVYDLINAADQKLYEKKKSRT